MVVQRNTQEKKKTIQALETAQKQRQVQQRAAQVQPPSTQHIVEKPTAPPMAAKYS